MLLDRDFLLSAQGHCGQPKLTVEKPKPALSEDLLNTYARYTKPPLAIDTTKPLPPESLAEFGISYSLVKNPAEIDDKVLDKVISEGQMTLRALRAMGISFQLV